MAIGATDVFPFSTAQVDLTDPSGVEQTLDLAGSSSWDVTIGPSGEASDTDGNGLDQASMGLVQLDLTGNSSFGPVAVRLSPSLSSPGGMEEQVNNMPGVLDLPPYTPIGTANSFFALFLEIDVAGTTLHTGMPLRVDSIVAHYPPDSGTTFQGVGEVELYDSSGEPTGFMLGSALYVPNPAFEFDFGDAPEGMYPTLLGSNGARHLASPNGPHLGSAVDTEPDGQPDANALGDDAVAVDDEDGVTIYAPALQPGDPAVWTAIDMQNSPVGGFLNAWVDFNGNGSWADPGDQIFRDEPVGPGLIQTLQFAVPGDAVAGATFARFRVSTERGLSFDGPARDGEVEDYQVVIGESTLKWYQPPDSAQPADLSFGWNEPSRDESNQWIAADDWICTSDQPVTEVVWWGSFRHWGDDSPPEVMPDGYHLAIWTDVPTDVDTPYSHPGQVVWEGDFQPDMEFAGWDFDPQMQAYEAAFRFDQVLPQDKWFYQDPGGDGVYWLSIGAIYGEGANVVNRWGWQTLPRDPQSPAPDAAMRVFAPTGAHANDVYQAGEPILWPSEQQPWDLAFQLNTSEAAAEPVAKWSQPPLPYQPLDAYNGWDESSLYGGDYVVADDWVCTTDQPVTDVHWWGSFIGSNLMAQPSWPQGFRISIWSDVPAGADKPFSHPGEVLWETYAENYSAESVGWDIDPRDPTATPERTYSFEYDLPEAEWFYQDADQGVYWVSIAADYADGSTVTCPFGWTTRPRDPNSPAPDDAVRIISPNEPVVGGQYTAGEPISGPTTAQSWDMAFALSTQILDWGDAPVVVGALGYPTLAANSGASHVVGGPWLGDDSDAPDGEPDGQPDPSALGDDYDGNDDEDGAYIPTLVQGVQDYISVEVNGGGGVLQVWIDFNGNSQWEPVEQVFNGPLSDGFYGIAVTAPAGSVVGQTFARFRISSQGGLLPTGPALDGEVEDHLVWIEESTLEPDFGDAPDWAAAPGYPTLLGNGGASHAIGGPWLGDDNDAPDGEPDGQPDSFALGDDFYDGNDDEDGVYIPTLLQGVQDYISVEVNGGGGVLQAWIDFDGNYQWDPSEQVFNGPVSEGWYAIGVTAPVDSIVGQTFARFRISTQGGLLPGGPALDGEVEDHAVRIEAASPPSKPKWEQPPELAQPNNVYLGWNEYSVQNMQIAADDWLCTGSEPVTEIVWWGSFQDWTDSRQAPLPEGFHLSIWTDVPAGTDESFSHPGEVIWQSDTGANYTWEFAGWDYDPRNMEYEATYRFDYVLPTTEWFQQDPEKNQVYWLSVAAVYPEGVFSENPFGWQARERDPQSAAPDAAVTVYDSTSAQVGDQYYAGWPLSWPSENHPWDLAFAINSQVTADPVINKWSQPPQPYVPDDAYNGWDEYSVYGGRQVVADDWICTTDEPVTDIHWWGSFIGWDFSQNLWTPDSYHITIWEDVPAGQDGYSHPGNLLWEADTGYIESQLVGWDFNPRDPMAPPEATFYFSYDLPENEWFYQEPGEHVYWISIAADYGSYGDPSQIAFPFGWTTRPRDPQSPAPDDAVRMFDPTRAGFPPMVAGFPVPNTTYVAQYAVDFLPADVVIVGLSASSLPMIDPTPLPAPGGRTVVDSYFDVFAELSIGGFAGGGYVVDSSFEIYSAIKITNPLEQPDASTQSYQMEMLNMDVQWGNLPDGVLLRESPTRQSLGQLVVDTTDGTLVDSFFDIWTEISLDGGQTWTPANQPLHMPVVQPGAEYVAGEPIFWPTPAESWDMAFVLTTRDTPQEELDWGDAPEIVGGPGYPTLTPNGASHVIGGPWLGDASDKPDGEFDGQPEASAMGDDLDGNDDENGVVIPTLPIGATANVTVTVSGGGGMVDAWIDFNQDFVWDEAERIHGGFLPDGTHTIAVDVPADAAAGQTFARFRISSQGGLSPGGAAADGEVEDYQVFVSSKVVGRHIFYNRSAFDDNDPGANAADDGAVATDKVALRPGQTATLANYTSYSRGINGIMIDVDGLPALPTPADFEFKVGNSNDPAAWTTAADPSITVRWGEGDGTSDRVTLIWPDNKIANQWLQVTVKATPNTGLAEPDVFYFGNAIGEAGNAAGNAIVNATDEIMARNFPHGALSPALIDDLYDYDRDRLVNGTDQIIARSHQTNPLDMLRLIAAEPTAKGSTVGQSDVVEATMADLGWLYEFAQTRRRSAKKASPVEATVDMLLATGW